MGTSFAAALTRLGQSTVARLANATLTVGAADPVDGIYEALPMVAPVGEIGMESRGPTFACLISDADAAGASEGVDVVVTENGVESDWRIADRDDDEHIGHAELTLERR